MVRTPQKCWGSSRGLARLLSSGAAGHAAYYHMLRVDTVWPCYRLQCDGKVICDVGLVPHPRPRAWAPKVAWKTKKEAGDFEKVYESVQGSKHVIKGYRREKTKQIAIPGTVTSLKCSMNSDNLPQIIRTIMWDWRPIFHNAVPGSFFPPYSYNIAV